MRQHGSGPWPIAVCVPVRDEAMLLPRFLGALSAQRGVPDFVLCALFDGCTDDSVAIVRGYAARAPFAIVTACAEASAPNAGRARRRAMALGLERLSGDDAVILSTDADSVPDPDWLSATIAALEVADVVAGRIVRDDDDDDDGDDAGAGASATQDRVEEYYDGLFRLRRSIDPVPWEAVVPHHYTSGASLGFRAGTYRALGGFEALASAEDARLIDAAHRAGLRVRRDGAVRVRTSSRRTGRAQNGLADHLRNLDTNDAAAVTMAHPEDACWRYAGHAAARAAWDDLDRRAACLAASLGCSDAHVRSVAAEAPNAEAFAMRVVPDVPGGERLVRLDEAERALAALWKRHRAAAA